MPDNSRLIYIHGSESDSNSGKALFSNLTVHIVEDDHRLHRTANEMDWSSILA